MKDVFGAIPEADYLDSIRQDIENAVEEISKDPVYFTLNLCRVLAFIQDGLVLSKKDGGYWGLKNVPARYAKVIQDAVGSYLEDGSSMIDAADELSLDFAKYMCDQIFAG